MGYYNTVYCKHMILFGIICGLALDAVRQLGDKPPSEMRGVTLALSLMGSI